MICCSLIGRRLRVVLCTIEKRMECPGELAKRLSSSILISIPIATVIIVVRVPVTARFFNKFACSWNSHIIEVMLQYVAFRKRSYLHCQTVAQTRVVVSVSSRYRHSKVSVSFLSRDSEVSVSSRSQLGIIRLIDNPGTNISIKNNTRTPLLRTSLDRFYNVHCGRS